MGKIVSVEVQKEAAEISSSLSGSSLSKPGTPSIPYFVTIDFAVILSPICLIVSELGPINLNPLRLHCSAKE